MVAIFIIILTLLTHVNYAWNAIGHRVIAQIAYDNLTTKTKKLFIKYNNSLDKAYKHQSFLNAAVWLDTLHGINYKSLQLMHYIDLPFTTDNTMVFKPKYPNAISAIKHANYILLSKYSTDFQKGIQFRIMLHVVSDLHQPLHAINRFSKKFPYGDHGGNLLLLPYNSIGKNLHAYWDNGGGLLSKQNKNINHIKLIARKILKKWPCKLQSNKINYNIAIYPQKWAHESFIIAKTISYNIYPNWPYQYKKQVQYISKRRLALAGCRIAKIFNQYTMKHKYTLPY